MGRLTCFKCFAFEKLKTSYRVYRFINILVFEFQKIRTIELEGKTVKLQIVSGNY